MGSCLHSSMKTCTSRHILRSLELLRDRYEISAKCEVIFLEWCLREICAIFVNVKGTLMGVAWPLSILHVQNEIQLKQGEKSPTR